MPCIQLPVDENIIRSPKTSLRSHGRLVLRLRNRTNAAPFGLTLCTDMRPATENQPRYATTTTRCLNHRWQAMLRCDGGGNYSTWLPSNDGGAANRPTISNIHLRATMHLRRDTSPALTLPTGVSTGSKDCQQRRRLIGR
jgi:hypothetical protein